MGNKKLGLYNKFTIKRNDNMDRPGRKHHGCEYFVLDLSHDDFAIDALLAYQRACRKEYPLLSDDIRKILNRIHFNKLTQPGNAKEKE